jgi:hypothetical protein
VAFALTACSTGPTYPGDAVVGEVCNETPEDQLDVGLALSGGGYRAMLFNLGSLWCLNDFGVLRDIDMIASVSGGSIVNGLLATRWRDLDWVPGGLGWTARNFRQEIAEPIIAFAGKTIDVPSVLERWCWAPPPDRSRDTMTASCTTDVGCGTMSQRSKKDAVPVFCSMRPTCRPARACGWSASAWRITA